MAQDVVVSPDKLSAHLTVSESSRLTRRCLLEERTPHHTRERPSSRREALRQVESLPQDDDGEESDLR